MWKKFRLKHTLRATVLVAPLLEVQPQFFGHYHKSVEELGVGDI
jgi:hypothetical protein